MAGSKPDLVVVGAGIVGLSSAYYIKKLNPDLDITVIDRAPTIAQGNTAKSAAGFRDLFTSDINFKLSNSTVQFFRDVQTNQKYDLGMKFVGYLFLMGKKDRRLEYMESLSKKTGVRFYDQKDLEDLKYMRVSPGQDNSGLMSLPDIEIAALGQNCGIIDPDLVCNYYYEELKKMGVNFSFNTEVLEVRLSPVNPLDYPGEPFLWQDKTISLLRTNRGEFIADRYLLATDVWTTALTDPLGIDSHIRPKKRQVFQVSGERVRDVVLSSHFTEEGIFPFTILPKDGVYLRPAAKEKSFWVGVADDIGRDFSFSETPEAEDDFYNMSLYQVARSYFPVLEGSRVTAKWAGYYSYNTIDKTPFIFTSMNLIIATGTSGSGILKGDGIGRYSEAVFSGREKAKMYNGAEIDTSSLGVDYRMIDKEKIIL